jgi:hypothetical protein
MWDVQLVIGGNMRQYGLIVIVIDEGDSNKVNWQSHSTADWPTLFFFNSQWSATTRAKSGSSL